MGAEQKRHEREENGKEGQLIISDVGQLATKNEKVELGNAVGAVHSCNHGKRSTRWDRTSIVMDIYIPTYPLIERKCMQERPNCELVSIVELTKLSIRNQPYIPVFVDVFL